MVVLMTLNHAKKIILAACDAHTQQAMQLDVLDGTPQVTGTEPCAPQGHIFQFLEQRQCLYSLTTYFLLQLNLFQLWCNEDDLPHHLHNVISHCQFYETVLLASPQVGVGQPWHLSQQHPS